MYYSVSRARGHELCVYSPVQGHNVLLCRVSTGIKVGESNTKMLTSVSRARGHELREQQRVAACI